MRGLAKETALSKDTVSGSLQRLWVAKLVRIGREQHDDSGRFVSVPYMVDIAAVPMLVSPLSDAVASPAKSSAGCPFVENPTSEAIGEFGHRSATNAAINVRRLIGCRLQVALVSPCRSSTGSNAPEARVTECIKHR